ncbi:nucleotide exchange factor GrpE [Alkalicaulis satelles]|uniref:Protein GrpE n=1 Tax=Alkalicaulis satelles TaxID=2609175 RepID=A0A5M6ZJD4_9PROT|nr:nucleotide exchange factor GrpE [Alkalicaulis satelles]KAA5803797.1 nucleotide exchange factor GrpE [Alkalicaulis satelles]
MTQTDPETPDMDAAPEELEAQDAAAEEAEAAEPDADEAMPDPEAVIAGLRDQLLRALAEADNARKRAQRDVKDAREYAVTGFARDMLDIADNLARALGAVSEEARASAGPALTTLLEGVELTERRLASTLERHGVRKVEPQPGEPLDPNRHQAAAQVPAPQPKGAIAHVMQPGYVIGERTLRAAMVVVSAGPAEGEASSADESQRPARPNGGVDVSA